MTIRPAESRLPEHFLAKPDADAKAQRAFWRGAAVFGLICAVVGFLIGRAA